MAVVFGSGWIAVPIQKGTSCQTHYKDCCDAMQKEHNYERHNLKTCYYLSKELYYSIGLLHERMLHSSVVVGRSALAVLCAICSPEESSLFLLETAL